MARRYLLEALPEPGPFRLGGPLAHHLGAVLRVRPGEALVLGDGRGAECDAVVREAGPAALLLAIGPPRRLPPPSIRIELAFAPPRWNRAEWLFEHGTEVGVMVFHPLWTGRTRPQGDRLERWRRLCTAAAGQCDRAFLPEVRPVRSLAEFLADPALPRERWLADPAGPALTQAKADAALLLVGPEGGFDVDERAAALEAGFLPRALGSHVLRTETAALVGAAVLGGLGSPAA